MASANIIQYENQVFKQVYEQPDYVKNTPMQRHQIAGFIKYTPQQTQFGPAFFNFAENISQRLQSILPSCQKVGLVYENGEQVSALIQQMRTTKALPLTLVSPPILQNSTGQPPKGFGRLKTFYDEDFVLVTETAEEVKGFLENISNVLGVSELNWSQTFYGHVLRHKVPQMPTQTSSIKKCHQEPATEPVELVETPGAHTMDDLAEFFKKPKDEMVKLVCYSLHGRLIIVHIRGDLGVSVPKLAHTLGLSPFDGHQLLQMATPELLARHGIVSGYGSACGAKDLHAATLVFDESIREMRDTIVGGNKEGYHFVHYDYVRDSAKAMKYINFADIAEEVNENESKFEEGDKETKDSDILAEAVQFITKVPLLGAGNKKVQAIITRIRIRFYELLLVMPNKQSHAIYCMQQIPAKFEDQRQRADEILKKINKKYYIIVDDRPKITSSQKQQLVSAGFFSHVIIFNKNTTEESFDGLTYDDEKNEFVEGTIQLADLQ